MRWTRGGTSANIEDRRGQIAIGGGIGTIVFLVLGLIFGRDFVGSASDGAPRTASKADDQEMVEFVSFVLDDAQTAWSKILPEQTRTPYRDAKLVLFTDRVQSGCGYGEAAMGPFYCPADEKAYIDLGFYDELRARFGAPGDFAQAYVLAHEIGHHVQKVLNEEERARRIVRPSTQAEQRDMRMRLELQADCFAGVWAHSTKRRDLLQAGDIEEAIGAASAVGDDRIQQQSTGRVNPETWTHGSSAQRVQWFKRGFASGRLEDCDPFSGSEA
ncbi:MAG: zinc metallopeptidase [Polyangiaceae bacterium]|nr:zinc metallopeptidase [Polyangiaceae bacterium]